MSTAPRERILKPLVFLSALVPLALLAWRAAADALGADPIRTLEIQTGLWTLRFLAIALAVTPVRRLTGLNWLAKYRRMLGLFVFCYATVHLSLWVGVDYYFDLRQMGEEIVKHRYILVGMLTWLLLLPLALTSTTGSIRRLGGRRWNQLHRLVYVAAVTGTVHYLWAVKKDTLFPVVYFVLFAALLGVRVWWARGGGAGPTRAATRSGEAPADRAAPRGAGAGRGARLSSGGNLASPRTSVAGSRDASS
ncbi:MAG: protein-methionine-sulfoxide reductase heme-binding subunit MsrQ [Gemmatimonadaceae bacterium]